MTDSTPKHASFSQVPVERIAAVTLKLLAYCRRNNWAGYDPYDALNSRVAKALPLFKHRLPRLAITQILKRSPLNLRGLMLVPKTHNAKAIALFLSALLKLDKAGLGHGQDLVQEMIGRLVALRSPGVPHWCWGYSFPWQTRRVVVPIGAPNLVCSTFCANALLDAYERHQEPKCLSMAVGTGEYLVNELYWEDGSAAGFSYPLPSLRGRVHNANFLAGAFLCRLYKHTGDEKFLRPALKVARYSAKTQHEDGSWYYGEEQTQKWIDNFHTGYNLCALKLICQCGETTEFESCIRRGFEFYRTHFFHQDGTPKYFHNRTYPVDIHCVAQSVITLTEFKHLDATSEWMADKVVRWALENMWDGRGFFYYRVLRFMTIRTSYMRWSEAWMLLALATLLQERQRGAAGLNGYRSLALVAASRADENDPVHFHF